MADPNDPDTLNLTPVAQGLVGAGTTAGANAAQLAAYQAIIQNLQNRFNDYSNVGPAGYRNITAQKLGASQLGSIPQDAQAQEQQQAAISQLNDISNRGGLNLSDMAALNQVQQSLNQNNSARANATANQYAARGELGSGQQMAMDLANNQNAATNANNAGTSAAAQAQARASQAVLQSAQASRTMQNDQYARQAAAANANDAIAQHNANYATDAGKYNNSIAGQAYQDTLSKLSGENQVTGQLNQALLGQGGQTAAGITAQGNIGNSLIGALGKAGGKLGGGGSSTGGVPDPGTTADTNGTRGGPGDLTGGQTDTNDPTTGATTSLLTDDGFEDFPG